MLRIKTRFYRISLTQHILSYINIKLTEQLCKNRNKSKHTSSLTKFRLKCSKLFYLGIFPTAIAFVLRFHLISKAGPVFLSYVAYLIPVFAIFWGYIFLKEMITQDTLIGIVLILLGVFLSQRPNAQNN